MTVGQLLREADSTELSAWMAYTQVRNKLMDEAREKAAQDRRLTGE